MKYVCRYIQPKLNNMTRLLLQSNASNSQIEKVSEESYDEEVQ